MSTKGKRHSRLFSKSSPTSISQNEKLPVELWILIITEALRPSLVLDTCCLASNMEEFYCTIADEEEGGYIVRKVHEGKRMRGTLSLVNRRFRDIVQGIPKKKTSWVEVDDNEPRVGYRAPKLRWGSYKSDHERLDLWMRYEHGGSIWVEDETPSSTFRLFFHRKPHDRNIVVTVQKPSQIIYVPESLKVLHLALDFCLLDTPRYMTEFLEQKTTVLTTLSLVLPAYNKNIELIDLPLSLPHLRTLFLKFHAYGANPEALSLWDLPALTILSLDLRIRRNGINPVKAVPDFVQAFVRRHGEQLSGLRLLSGPWFAPSDVTDVTTMTYEEHEAFWTALPSLQALTTDYAYFPPSSVRISPSTSRMMKTMRYLGQVRNARPAAFHDGLVNAIQACESLETVKVRRYSTETLVNKSSWIKEDDMAMEALRTLCRDRSIRLMDVLEGLL